MTKIPNKENTPETWLDFIDHYTKVVKNLVQLQMVIAPYSEPNELDPRNFYVTLVRQMRRDLERAEKNLKFVRKELKKFRQGNVEGSTNKSAPK